MAKSIGERQAPSVINWRIVLILLRSRGLISIEATLGSKNRFNGTLSRRRLLYLRIMPEINMRASFEIIKAPR